MHKKSAVPEFIEEERAKGTKDKDILHKLLDAGWHMDIIHHVMHKEDKGHPGNPLEPKPGLRDPRIIYPVAVGAILMVLILLALFV